MVIFLKKKSIWNLKKTLNRLLLNQELAAEMLNLNAVTKTNVILETTIVLMLLSVVLVAMLMVPTHVDVLPDTLVMVLMPPNTMLWMAPALDSLHHFSTVLIHQASSDVLISMNVLTTTVAVMLMLHASILAVVSNVFAHQNCHLEMVFQEKSKWKSLHTIMILFQKDFIWTEKGCFSDPNNVPTEAPVEEVTTTPAPVQGGGSVANDFNCAGQGTLSQVANVASDVAISCFGTSCGVQCVDPSKSPNVSGLFCQNTGKAKKQGWKNGNKVKLWVFSVDVSVQFLVRSFLMVA